jgi:adenylate cyclase
MVDPMNSSANLVSRVIELGVAGANGITRMSGDILLAALLGLLGKTEQADTAEVLADEAEVDSSPEEVLSPTEVITRGLLAGDGRYTRLEVAERAGIPPDEARRLWRALGFPEVGDDERIFTSADVTALIDANGLIAVGVVDAEALVELARPLGNLMSRLAAAQTSFISEVLGARIAAGLSAEDPEMPGRLAAQALVTTRELLPVLERTTMHAWRRHLAAEVGRALIPGESGPDSDTESQSAAVGFIDMTGYTRLSRNVELTDLGRLLDRFETQVLDTVVEHGGRVIKNLGDEILFVIEDPVSAAEATLHLLDAFSEEDAMPPMHAGLAFGQVLYRGGDVYGPVVNIAARLASLARKGTIRVDHGMATALGDAHQFTLSARTPRHVRGYLQLPNYRLRWAKGH